MSLIGYIRVSTEEQNMDRQTSLMVEIGCSKIFSEKLSGRSKERPELKRMLEYVREGDTVICESISRISRSTKDFLNIISELQDKKVEFRSSKESIDTSTAQGKFMMTVFAALSELEIEQTRQRQLEGIAIAKAQG